MELELVDGWPRKRDGRAVVPGVSVLREVYVRKARTVKKRPKEFTDKQQRPTEATV